VKRTLLIIAMGAIGIMLGVGLSLAVDAIAGSELSDPVPLGVTSNTAIHEPTETPEPERSEPSATRANDNDVHDRGGVSETPGDGSGQNESGASDGNSSSESPDGGGSDDSSAGADDSANEGEDD
jgi:hypothetical protein